MDDLIDFMSLYFFTSHSLSKN